MASRFETAKGRSTQIVNQWLAQRSLPDKFYGMKMDVLS